MPRIRRPMDSIMFFREADPRYPGGTVRARQQRRAAFPQRYHLREIVQERDELAVAPDAALVQRGVGAAARAPQGFQLIGGLRRFAVDRFQQTAALRAIVQDLGNGEPRAAPLFDTG